MKKQQCFTLKAIQIQYVTFLCYLSLSYNQRMWVSRSVIYIYSILPPHQPLSLYIQCVIGFRFCLAEEHRPHVGALPIKAIVI